MKKFKLVNIFLWAIVFFYIYFNSDNIYKHFFSWVVLSFTFISNKLCLYQFRNVYLLTISWVILFFYIYVNSDNLFTYFFMSDFVLLHLFQFRQYIYLLTFSWATFSFYTYINSGNIFTYFFMSDFALLHLYQFRQYIFGQSFYQPSFCISFISHCPEKPRWCSHLSDQCTLVSIPPMHVVIKGRIYGYYVASRLGRTQPRETKYRSIHRRTLPRACKSTNSNCIYTGKLKRAM